MRDQARLISDAADCMGELLELALALSVTRMVTHKERTMLARASIMKADLETEALRLMNAK